MGGSHRQRVTLKPPLPSAAPPPEHLGSSPGTLALQLQAGSTQGAGEEGNVQGKHSACISVTLARNVPVTLGNRSPSLPV